MIVNPYTSGGFPGLTLKAWAVVSAAGALVKGFNVTSITVTAVGRRTINFTTALATTSYPFKVQTSGNTVANIANAGQDATKTTTALAYQMVDAVGNPYNADHYIEVWE